jgi:hypothetical protein
VPDFQVHGDPAITAGGVGPVTAIILAWERPLYLWAALDSLYRNTRTNVDFVIIDNHSRDPLVAKVIDGFNRRGMFREIVASPVNDPLAVKRLLVRLGPHLGRYFAYIEADVVVKDTNRCWAATMVDIMEARPRLAMLGSQVSRDDFIDPEWVVGRVGHPLDDRLVRLTKIKSRERSSYVAPGTVGEPHNPPGRLMMLRSAAIAEVGMAADAMLYRKLRKRGYECATTGDVVHRHLSLLNFFDYPEYDVYARTEFMEKFSLPLPESGDA